MDVTDVIGRFGPWQKRIFYVILYRAIPAAFIILNVQFFTPEIDHWCARDANFSVDQWRNCCVPTDSKCSKYVFEDEINSTVECDAWEYDSKDHGSNIKQEWNLVCDRTWLISLSYTLFTLGNFVSYIPAGHLADRYGRRPMTLIGMTSVAFIGAIGYFSPNVEFFLVLRFIVGLLYGFYQTPSICLFLEAVGPEYRILMSLSFLGTWGLGMCLLAGVALVVTEWRTLQLISFIPIALVSPLLIWKFVPESTRWLITVGRYSEAQKIICDAAKMNGKEIQDIDDVMKALQKKIEEDEVSVEAQKKHTFFDLFRTRKLCKMTIIIYLTLTLTVFIYYGFTLTVGNLGGSLYMNIFIMGLTEGLSSGVFLLESKYMRRRRALLLNFILSGLSFFITLAIPADITWLRISVAMLGRTCNSLAYALLWLFSAEIFPTNLRAVGVSGGMSAGRIGSMVATTMDELGRVAGKNTPIAIFGTLAIVTSVLFLLLPETKDKHLPDTIKQSERLPDTMEMKE